MNVWISVIVIEQWQFWGVKRCYHSASGMFSIRHAHLSLWQKWPRSHFFFLSGKRLTSFSNQWSFFTLEEFVLWHMCILVWKDLVGGLIYWFDIWWMRIIILYIWFSSVTQSYPTLCNPMDCRTPGLPAPGAYSNSCP